MLKDQLLKEAQAIEATVELDSIFESVELSEDVKQNFALVFETTVKKHAIALAESHIAVIAESADAKVEELVESRVTDLESKLIDIADRMFEHTKAEWLEENKLAVENGVKANLFESMFEGIKTLAVEHNLVLPEQSIDVVAELEGELQENKDEASRLFNALTESQAAYSTLQRAVAVDKAIVDLTESQKEQVQDLIEGLDYSDSFETKLGAIVAMAKGPSAEPAPSMVTEAAGTPAAENTSINKINEDAAGLNFVVEGAITTSPDTKAASPKMNSYVAAAKRL